MDAAIYCRISNDQSGDAVGVTRQERECRALAARRGMHVAAVFVDNDVSAYSGVARPAYSQLLMLVGGGSLDAVIAWHPDRLHRSLRELEEFITVLDRHQVDVFTVTAGDVDLSTPIGRMIARQLGTFARYESEHRSERSVAGKRDAAEQGRWSSAAPYGYDLPRDAAGNPVGNGRLAVNAVQARVIREAARRVLAGETVYAVCRDFNARGITAPRGGPWRTQSMRATLVSPTTAGLRDYRGTVVAVGQWSPILSGEQHAALRTRLSDNRRTKGIRSARKYLLVGGLITCGRCGSRLYTQLRVKTKVPIYYCVPGVDKDGCGGIAVRAVPVERYVLDSVFDQLGRDAVSRLLANPRAFSRELNRRTEHETRMLELAATYAAGEISRAEWVAARNVIAAQLRTMPTSAAHLGGLELADPDTMQDQWRDLPIDSQRELLALVIDTIIVMPATKRGAGFDSRRVEIRWR